MVKIGAELPKLSQKLNWVSVLDHPAIQGGPKRKPLPNNQKIVLKHVNDIEFTR